MEILNYRAVLPVLVNYKYNNKECSVFVYVDYINKDVIIADGDVPEDSTELRKAIYAYINSQKRIVSTPSMPKEGFNKLNPDQYDINQD